MIVSDAKREANRRNALKSTGPRTPEGKDRSRLNALKHGLTALVVVPEDAAQIQDRAAAYFWSLKPRNVFQRHLVDEVAVLSLRVDRAQRIERKLRDAAALRAITSWDDDRRLDAERVGRDLAIRPSEVVAELRRTPQGCDWLLDRWAMLARLADAEKTWAEPARRLAFDLLGTPPEVRAGHPGAAIDPDGRVLDDGSDPAAVARGRIAELRLAREAAAEADAIARELAEADLAEDGPEVRRVRRYEGGLHRRVRWCLARLKDPIPEHRPPFDLIPDYNPKSEAEALAEAQAEVDAKAERDAKFEAEYHAKAERRQAEAREREEAKARRRRRPAPTTLDEATAPVPNEAKFEAPNEATEQAPNEATGRPATGPRSGPPTPPDAAADRRDARARKAESRRGSKRRKLDRRRA